MHYLRVHRHMADLKQHERDALEAIDYPKVEPHERLVGVNALYLNSDEDEHFWTIMSTTEMRAVALQLLQPPTNTTFTITIHDQNIWEAACIFGIEHYYVYLDTAQERFEGNISLHGSSPYLELTHVTHVNASFPAGRILKSDVTHIHYC